MHSLSALAELLQRPSNKDRVPTSFSERQRIGLAIVSDIPAPRQPDNSNPAHKYLLQYRAGLIPSRFNSEQHTKPVLAVGHIRIRLPVY